MLLQRKTTTKHLTLRGNATVYSDPKAFLGRSVAEGGTVSPQNHVNIVMGEVTPALTIKIEGLGELYLSPAEVFALRQTINNVVQRSFNPQNYIESRHCRWEL